MYLDEVLDFEDAAISDCGGHSGDLNLLGVPDTCPSGLHRASCPQRTINQWWWIQSLSMSTEIKKINAQCRRIKTLSIISLQSVVSVKMYLLRKFALIYSIFPYFTQNTWYHAKLCSAKLWFVPSKKDLGLVQGGMRGHGARGVVVELGKNLNRLPYKMTRPM